MNACIVGWAHTPFGKLENDDVESLIRRVVTDVLADARVEPEDVDEIYLGHFNGGFCAQEFPASLILQGEERLRFKPITRVENACATGSAAIQQGLKAIAAKQARVVLVVGVEKMTSTPGPRIGEILASASYVKEEADKGSFVEMFAHITETYFAKYGDKSDALARIAAKNHRNGVANPFAQIRKELSYEFCREVSEKNPVTAGPLKRTDCSPVSDGAAALVLAARDTARGMPKAVAFRATSHVNDYLPMSRRDMSRLEGCEQAWKRVLARAGVALSDLSLVETHDCFTTAELLQYEAMGLTPFGEGERAIMEGWTEKDGRLPVNPSGGLKSKGHPIGATGVSMHLMAAMQLAGAAGGMQIPNAELAGVFNMGGSGVANYASILERLN